MALARRNLKSRGTGWAKFFSVALGKLGLKPNHISVLSIVFAALAAYFYCRASKSSSWSDFLLAALCIQLRLFCNLMDGMLAVELGLKSKTGDLYNEVPDRFADIAILVGAGWAAIGPHKIELSWAVAVLAVLTAYVRLLGGALGVHQYFLGPMAKQHRMFTMTVGTLLAAFWKVDFYGLNFIYLTLALIALGSLLTFFRRLSRVAADLAAR